MADYQFRQMTKADLPMFRHWLEQPHINGWWGDSRTEARLVEADIDKGCVDMRIVSHGGTPFAYIQDYNAHAFGAPHYATHPAQARAIDMFLGDPAFLGKGHASRFLAARLRALRAACPCVLTDPDPANTRAIATYTRAGFRPLETPACADGGAVHLMIHDAHAEHIM